MRNVFVPKGRYGIVIRRSTTVFCANFFVVFWIAFLKQSLDSLQVAELNGSKRKFKEDFGRKRKKDENVCR